MKGEINISKEDVNSKDKKVVDMSNDYVFKKIFNTPEYIKAFYEAMFKETVDGVQIVEGTQLVSEDIYGKSPILDCLAILDDVVFHMEMQNKLTKDFIKRVLYCAFALVVRFVRKGSEYGDIGKARVVWIVDGAITKEDKIYVDKMENIWKLKQSLVGSELVEIYIIELPKLMKDKFKTYDIKDKFNQMVYMIKGKEEDENMEAIKQMNPIVEEITKTVRRLTEDEMTQIEMWRQEECERAGIEKIGI